MTQEKDPWPYAARIIHLVGGCRAINNPGPIVNFEPVTVEGKAEQFKIDTYGSIYLRLEALGIGIIGVDFYTHILEFKRIKLPQWRSFQRAKNTSWPVWEIAQKWSNIAYAAFKNKIGKLWDIGSRISHQLNVCDWRLREISESYRNQLSAKIRGNDFEVGQSFEDDFTWLAYLSIQSFLVDACILRDYLAEFVSEFIYNESKITRMSSLKNKILNKTTSNDYLIQNIKQQTSEDGWIKLLGDYRNLIVHYAPLALAERRLFSVCDKLTIGENICLPIIRCPIPENPARISASRYSSNHFANFEDQLNVFAKAAKGDIPIIDGLDYASAVLGNLATLLELETVAKYIVDFA